MGKLIISCSSNEVGTTYFLLGGWKDITFTILSEMSGTTHMLIVLVHSFLMVLHVASIGVYHKTFSLFLRAGIIHFLHTMLFFNN